MKCQNNNGNAPLQHIPIDYVKIFHLVILNLSKTVQHPQIKLCHFNLEPQPPEWLQHLAEAQAPSPASITKTTRGPTLQLEVGHKQPVEQCLGAAAARRDTLVSNGQHKPGLVDLTKRLSSERSASDLSASFCFSLEGLFHT